MDGLPWSSQLTQALDQAGDAPGESRAERHRAAIAAFIQVARELAGALDPLEAAERVVRTVLRLFHSHHSALFRNDPVSGATVCVAIAGNFGSTGWIGKTLPPRAGVVGRAIAERRAVWVKDLRAEERDVPEWMLETRRQHRLRWAAAAPLIVQGEMLGALALADTTGQGFTEEDLELLGGFADLAALALRNAELFRASEARACMAETLAAVGRTLSGSLDPERVAEQITDSICDLLRTRTAVLWKLASGNLAPLAASGTLRGLLTAHSFVLPPGAGAAGLAMSARRPITTPDFLTDSRLSLTAELRSLLDQWGLRAALAVPLLSQETVLGALVTADRAGRAFNEEEVRVAQAFADQAALALKNADLFAASEARRRVTEALADMQQLLSRSLETEEIAQQITDNICRLLQVSLSALWRLKGESGDLALIAISGKEESSAGPGAVLPRGTGAVGLAVTEHRPVVTPDLLTDPRFTFPPWARARIGRGGLRAALTLPLITQEKVIGALGIRDRTGRVFTDEEVRLAQAFANQAAIALENSRLFREVRVGRSRLEALSRRLVQAQETERRYIARELHDEIGQLLTALRLSLERGAPAGVDEHATRLSGAQELVNEIIRRVRDLSLDLRPAMLDDLGLLPSLLWYFKRYTQQTRVGVTFEHTGIERRFQAEVETAAYRIVQEALTNVARHAGVRQATVRVWADQLKLGVQVEDRGKGFDSKSVMGAGAPGLAGMRERALLLGGQMTIESAPGAGTRVMAELPVESGLTEE